jgi:hypothetical protein
MAPGIAGARREEKTSGARRTGRLNDESAKANSVTMPEQRRKSGAAVLAACLASRRNCFAATVTDYSPLYV